ncbi:MAG: hypothetical protein QG623_460 [Patescibacteria group bacterium]|nr:hypothetical protein [Patescibacteria group bacterium]
MFKAPETLEDLVKFLSDKSLGLDSEHPELAASSIVGGLGASDHWEEWYENNETIQEIFDLSADLELTPNHHMGGSIPTVEDIPVAISRLKELILKLEKEVS